MKKFVIGIFVVSIALFALLGFKYHKSTTSPLPLVQQTLDGVDELTARQMINNFAANYDIDISSKSVSAFYTIDQIAKINNLLINEHNNSAIATDGIRLYFGSNQPLDANTKLKVSILMVSTSTRNATNSNHNSTHADYYIHTGGILSTVEIGMPTNDNGTSVLKLGGLLYGPNSPLKQNCNTPTSHFLSDYTAYNWVQKRFEGGGNDQSAYTTKSEWFSYCFINSFFTALVNNGYSGLRIYLGKGFLDGSRHERDVFILVPTKSVGGIDQDDYHCLEDLNNPTFCYDTQPFIKRDSLTNSGNGGGYDEGELCPDVCE